MRTRGVVTAIAAGLGMALALAACSTSTCDQWQSWRNEPSTACQACLATSCAMEQSAEVANAATCQPEYACVERCPMGSATSCGCVDSCFATDDCHTTYNALVSCAVSNCTGACQ